MPHRSFLLYPLSFVYGMAASVRNILYDRGLLKSAEYKIPIICIGNITVGGTGKTPHTEYLLRLLKDRYKIAVLSRGYKRKKKGFGYVDKTSTALDAGDEPFQIYSKFPNIIVAVDGDRRNGIETILGDHPDTDLIIMDDGFQHRRVKPGLSIVLSTYENPVYADHILPYGNLRERASSLKRADIVIVTKTNENMSAEQLQSVTEKINRCGGKKVFFSSVAYMELEPLLKNGTAARKSLASIDKNNTCAVLVSGIANPEPVYRYLKPYFHELVHVSFPDHHRFREKDIKKIMEIFASMRSPLKYIVTTEKDSVRMTEFFNVLKPVLPFLYYLPVEIKILNGEEDNFNKILIDYVGENKGDR